MKCMSSCDIGWWVKTLEELRQQGLMGGSGGNVIRGGGRDNLATQCEERKILKF